jgi:hypothetical protein
MEAHAMSHLTLTWRLMACASIAHTSGPWPLSSRAPDNEKLCHLRNLRMILIRAIQKESA